MRALIVMVAISLETLLMSISPPFSDQPAPANADTEAQQRARRNPDERVVPETPVVQHLYRPNNKSSIQVQIQETTVKQEPSKTPTTKVEVKSNSSPSPEK